MGQQIAYMTADYVGTATRFFYGKKGDRVEVLKVDYSGMALVKNNGVLFHVKKEMLSSVPTDACQEPEVTPIVSDARPANFRGKQTKIVKQNLNQQTLF